jgi:hypothetical protein
MKLIRYIAQQNLLRLVLCLVFVVQGALASSAMAQMDAAIASPEQIVICTPNGVQTIAWTPDVPENQDAGCECPCGALCNALAGAFSPKGADCCAIPFTMQKQAGFVVVASMDGTHQRRVRQGPSPRAPPQKS